MSLPAKNLARSVLALLLAAAAAAQRGTLTIEREIVLRGGGSHSLAWSPDGKRIASGGECGDVLVVEADTGRVVHELLAADHWIGALLFSPDGNTLFVGGRELTRWDLSSGKQTARTALAYPTPVALTRDGARIASVRDNSTVELRKASDFHLERTLTVPDETAVDALVFDREAARLAVGKRSGKAYVFAIASGEIVAQPELSGWVSSLAYLDDNSLVRLDREGALLGFTNRAEALGKHAWGMAVDPPARLCLTWNGERVRGFTREGPAFVVPGPGPAAIHPDGTTWVRARDARLELHRGDELVRALPLAHRARPGPTVFVGDGTDLAIGTHVVDLTNGAAVPIPEGLLRGQPIPYAVGAELAMWQAPTFLGEEVGTLSLWSIAALRAGERRPVREHRIPCSYSDDGDSVPVFSGEGRFFAINDSVRGVLEPEQTLWRVPDRYLRTLHAPPGGRSAWAEEYSDSGFWRSRLTLRLLSADVKDGPVREFWYRGVIAWSPDCSRILLWQHDGVHVVDTNSGTSLGFMTGSRWHGEWIDNDTLVVPGHDGKFELVAIPACTAIATLDLPCAWGAIAKAADGNRAAVVAHDRVIVVRVGGD